jgi:glycosyltransferase involved in cell wall biosynthesis
MRVAILHYHLRGGGVTRVIGQAAAGLAARGASVCVLTGEAPGADFPDVPAEAVAGLSYGDGAPEREAEALRADLDEAAARCLGGAPDLWHVHNHALGKNPALTAVVRDFAEEGRPLLLQIHDFAEDGRPALYRALREAFPEAPGGAAAALYPQGPRVHYATINARDAAFLRRAGIPEERVHILPNAAEVPPADPEGADTLPAGDRRLVLYPVRGIRRKNLGEFLLWSALAEEDALFALTLAPKNPAQQAVYARWTAFAEETDLPAAFNVGAEWAGGFPAVLTRADLVVTTSIAEGFGLTFLEPFLAGKPLAGRKLPEITDAFETEGLDLATLYPRLDVPIGWVGRDALRERIAAVLPEVLRAYGREATDADVDAALAAAAPEDRVDFGALDEPMQEEVIRRLRTDPALRNELRPPALVPAGETPAAALANREVTRSAFRPETCLDRLLATCDAVLSSPGGPADTESGFDADALLDAFLAPERFRLLRTSL